MSPSRSRLTGTCCSAIMLGVSLFGSVSNAAGIALDISSPDSIKQAASTVAYDMMTLYIGNQSGQTPGLLQPPLYWWEAGGMFGALIDYWYYTGDATYNDVTSQGILFQVGQYDNFEPSNQTLDLGNDDQAFWGFAAMSAAENRFPNPPSDQPQWLALAQAVFNRQVLRWDPSTCNGGLRWQVFIANPGYNYKNSIANGCLFNLAARLGKYTGNQTYLDWAEKLYDWTVQERLIRPEASYTIFDGIDTYNCTNFNYLQWTYNLGVFMMGAAAMWNVTQDPVWHDRLSGLLYNGTRFFFNETTDVMFEAECENRDNCNNDQLSYKSYLSRWMAQTAQVAPWTYDFILPKLQASAQAAVKTCTGGTTSTFCGFQWFTGAFDGLSGVGQQMNALQVVDSLLLPQVKYAPLTNSTGGNSTGKVNAGAGGGDPSTPVAYNIHTADRAGGWILTVLFAGLTFGVAVWAIL